MHVNPISFPSPVYIPVLCPGSVWCLSLDLHVSCWFLSNLIFYLESLLICYSCWHSHFPFLIVRRIHIHHIFPHWFVRSGKRVVCMYSVENIRQNTATWLFIGKYTNIESWALCIRISKLLSLWAPLFSLSLWPSFSEFKLCQAEACKWGPGRWEPYPFMSSDKPNQLVLIFIMCRLLVSEPNSQKWNGFLCFVFWKCVYVRTEENWLCFLYVYEDFYCIVEKLSLGFIKE